MGENGTKDAPIARRRNSTQLRPGITTSMSPLSDYRAEHRLN
jgi:hypothetical protein